MRSEKKISQPGFQTALLIALSLVTSGSLLTGCGPSFSPSSQVSCAGNCENNANGTIDPGKTPDANGGGSSSSDAWNNLKVDGVVSDGWAANTPVVELDKANKELVVRLPMLANPFLILGMPSIQLPEIPGARLTLEPLPNDRLALALRIPLSRFLKGIESIPPSKLPNGDPLPGVPDGEMPSVAVQLTRIRDIKASIYLSPATVGIFVNTPFDPTYNVSVPIRNEARTQILGYFSSVAAKSTYEGGFFISVKLPSEIARIIDDNI